MMLLLFARARDLIGTDHLVVSNPEPATIGDLRQRLVRQYPHIAGLVEKSAFAVNDEFADDAVPIPVGAEVALLPPVSGG
jgi:molybdopterin converting factor subunit 1